MRSLYAPSSWIGDEIIGSTVPVPWRLIPADASGEFTSESDSNTFVRGDALGHLSYYKKFQSHCGRELGQRLGDVVPNSQLEKEPSGCTETICAHTSTCRTEEIIWY